MEGFFYRIFLGQRSFPLSYPFGYICFFYVFIQFLSQFVMDGREFFKPESMYAIMASLFSIQYCFECSSERFQA